MPAAGADCDFNTSALLLREPTIVTRGSFAERFGAFEARARAKAQVDLDRAAELLADCDDCDPEVTPSMMLDLVAASWAASADEIQQCTVSGDNATAQYRNGELDTSPAPTPARQLLQAADGCFDVCGICLNDQYFCARETRSVCPLIAVIPGVLVGTAITSVTTFASTGLATVPGAILGATYGGIVAVLANEMCERYLPRDCENFITPACKACKGREPACDTPTCCCADETGSFCGGACCCCPLLQAPRGPSCECVAASD